MGGLVENLMSASMLLCDRHDGRIVNADQCEHLIVTECLSKSKISTLPGRKYIDAIRPHRMVVECEVKIKAHGARNHCSELGLHELDHVALCLHVQHAYG